MTLLQNAPSDIVIPCADSNPRFPNKGVWGILYHTWGKKCWYYGTYITAVFRNKTLENGLIHFRQTAFFAWYPFWDFTWLELNVSSPFSQMILVNLKLWLYPKFECNGAQIANTTISPVSWALCEPENSWAKELISLEKILISPRTFVVVAF